MLATRRCFWQWFQDVDGHELRWSTVLNDCKFAFASVQLISDNVKRKICKHEMRLGHFSSVCHRPLIVVLGHHHGRTCIVRCDAWRFVHCPDILDLNAALGEILFWLMFRHYPCLSFLYRWCQGPLLGCSSPPHLFRLNFHLDHRSRSFRHEHVWSLFQSIQLNEPFDLVSGRLIWRCLFPLFRVAIKSPVPDFWGPLIEYCQTCILWIDGVANLQFSSWISETEDTFQRFMVLSYGKHISLQVKL